MLGVENKPTVFFLTQSQISEESMYNPNEHKNYNIV